MRGSVRISLKKDAARAFARRVERGRIRRRADLARSGCPGDSALSRHSTARTRRLRPDAARDSHFETIGRRPQLQNRRRRIESHTKHDQLSPPAYLRETASPLQERSGRKSSTQPPCLNRNKKHWDRSNHGDHGASRGKAITIVIPVFPAPPVVEPMRQCCLV